MGIGVILLIEGGLNLLSMGYTAFVVRKYRDVAEQVQEGLEDLVNQAQMPDPDATLEGTARELDPDEPSDPDNV